MLCLPRGRQLVRMAGGIIGFTNFVVNLTPSPGQITKGGT